MTAVSAPAPPRTRRLEPDPTPGRPVGHRIGLAGLVTILALLVALFSLAVFHAQITQRAYELEHLEDQIDERADEVAAARLEVASLESPSRLQDSAEVLGLDRPDTVAHVVPDDELVERVLDSRELVAP